MADLRNRIASALRGGRDMTPLIKNYPNRDLAGDYNRYSLLGESGNDADNRVADTYTPFLEASGDVMSRRQDLHDDAAADRADGTCPYCGR